ncbi:ParA family protein [Massilia sp. CT11-108]|uniref:ParA family protein n=1 Tax=Massilia sp. CT11-108 TaxID=3393900 RepID=UPI0039A6B87B
MLKLLVNTPKGGVGKTTTATNIALLLARQGQRILAVDLAGGLIMSRVLSTTPEFSRSSGNRIIQMEGEGVPDNFSGASGFDYAVLDTDDSFVVSADLLRGTRSGWRVLSPINPHDTIGLDRIPRELRAVLTTTALTPSELRLSVFANMAHGGEVTSGLEKIRTALCDHGIESTLANTHLPYSPSENAPILLEDPNYTESLQSLLYEVL